MDFGITTHGERGAQWLKAAMIVCFAAAAATLAYAITSADALHSPALHPMSRTN